MYQVFQGTERQRAHVENLMKEPAKKNRPNDTQQAHPKPPQVLPQEDSAATDTHATIDNGANETATRAAGKPSSEQSLSLSGKAGSS